LSSFSFEKKGAEEEEVLGRWQQQKGAARTNKELSKVLISFQISVGFVRYQSFNIINE
jgi:hypothetical protein